jgi:ubiquinone/menaquinone biosynthesis C-methylase UbiE
MLTGRKMNTKINYNQIAGKYDSTRTSNSSTIDLFHKKVKFGKETKVLDFGCGTGNYLNTIFDLFRCTCFGVEPSDSMRAIAKQKNSEVQIKKGSHELIPFPDNEFDFVYMTDVIHHIPNMNKMFSELNRLIKPSGLMCIVTESHNQIENRFYNRYFPSLESVELKRYPDISEINEYAVNNSFVTVEIQKKEDSNIKITEDFIKLVSEKGYSMFKLISEEEHQKGLENLIADFNSDVTLISSGETLIWLKKNK